MRKKTYFNRLPGTPQVLRPVIWIGSALQDLRGLPEQVQDTFGYALHQAQCGKHHPGARQLRGYLRGLVELIDDFDGDTYRALYTVKIGDAVYVLHVFQKKATQGIATPRHEIAVIRERWRRARMHYAAQRGGRG